MGRRVNEADGTPKGVDSTQELLIRGEEAMSRFDAVLRLSSKKPNNPADDVKRAED